MVLVGVGLRIEVSINFIQRNFCCRNLRKYRTFMTSPEANLCSMRCYFDEKPTNKHLTMQDHFRIYMGLKSNEKSWNKET